MRPLFSLLAATLVTTALTVVGATAPAHADNKVTPGNFTGYGFDQCLTPSQGAMDDWMENSPFSAVGIYISGASRGCRSQPNLTRTWVANQLKNRWVLLPITLGPQASCSEHFPRYGNDPVINASTRNAYAAAKLQARKEVDKAIEAATALGITRGSTLWYDLEAFDISKTTCRESAIRFLHAWTQRLHDKGWKSGVYSSASSGIKMLDDVRRNGPSAIELPDAIWIARWDNVANLSTSYISDSGWMPHKRVKQYKGGHNEKWGSTTINIDSNWMSLGRGSLRYTEKTLCSGVNINLSMYGTLSPSITRSTKAASALQCLLRSKGFYRGKIDGIYDTGTRRAQYQFQRSKGATPSATWTRRFWMMLLSDGGTRTVKRGHTSPAINRMQRALTAATGTHVPVTGTFDGATEKAVKTWQRNTEERQSGVVNTEGWRLLQRGLAAR